MSSMMMVPISEAFSEVGTTYDPVTAMVHNLGFHAGKTHPGFLPLSGKRCITLKEQATISCG